MLITAIHLTIELGLAGVLGSLAYRLGRLIRIAEAQHPAADAEDRFSAQVNNAFHGGVTR